MTLDDTFLIRDAAAPEMPQDAIRLGAFQSRTTVLGPGNRAVIWVAGCLRRCPGCIKPELFSFTAGSTVPIGRLAERIQQVPNLQGVTFSGGEPFEQAHALAKLALLLKKEGLDVLVYTGYQLSVLHASPERFGTLLAVADYIIDGEYHRDLPGPFPWRGSSNQTIYDFREKMALNVDSAPQCREVQLSIGANGLRMIGFPSQELVNALGKRLSSRGLQLRPVDGVLQE